MSSSLQRQLAAARGSGNVGSRPSAGTRVSILFERHEAADYDRQTILALGLSGLDALIARGASELAAFRDGVFGKAVSESDREMLAPEVEQELATALDKLLAALCKYALDKDAHKVLEYLVRQFHVHEQNADALVRCVLPFHDTDIFVRVVALPVAVDKTRWAFLKQVAKSKEPLARNQLVKVCVAEPAVLGAIADMAVHQSENERVVSFFTVLACQALRRARQRGEEDKLVNVLMGPTVDALRARRGPEHLQRAGYVVAANLARYAALSDKAAKLILLSTVRKARSEMLSEALRCCAVVLQNQEDLVLPESSVSRLATHFNAKELSAALTAAFGETPQPGSANEDFVVQLYAQLAASTEALPRLVACLQECMPVEVQGVFRALAENQASDNADALAAGRLIATQRGDQVDKLLEGIDDGVLLNFASACFAGDASLAAHQVVNGVTLRAALHHHKASVRRHALVQLLEGELTRDTVPVRVLMDRVMDDNLAVAVAAVELAAKLFALPSNSQEGSNKNLECFVADAALTACARHGSDKAFAAVFCSWAPVITPLANNADFLNIASGLLTLTQGASQKTVFGALLGFAQANKHISLAAGISGKSLASSSEAFVTKMGSWLLSENLAAENPQIAAASCLALADAVADSKDASVVEMAAFLATAPQVDVEAAAAVLERIASNKALTSGSPKDAVHSGAEEVPPALKVLCRLLAAPETIYQDACAKSVQGLLTMCFQDVLLQTLLVISAGAIQETIAPSIAQRRAIVLATAFIRAMRDPEGTDGLGFAEVTPYLIQPLCHRGDSSLRSAAVDCARAIFESVTFDQEYLGSKGSEALPKTSKSCTRKLTASKAFTTILSKIVEAEKEFIVDADTFERCLRGLHEQEALLALLERAACMVCASAPSDDAALTEKGVSIARCVENMLRPLGKVPDLSAVLSSHEAAMLAREALDHGMMQVLSILTHRWTNKKCDLDREHIQVILQGLRIKSARATVLHALSAQHVFALLTAAEKNDAFDALCSLVAEEGSGSTLSHEAISAMGRVPFDGKMLQKKLLTDPNRVVLEATRARLYGARSGAHSTSDRVELAVDLLPALFEVLRKFDDLLVLSCLNCAMQILESAPSKDADQALMAVDLDLVVSCVLNAGTTAARNTGLELLATCTKAFPQQTIPVVLPIVKQVSNQAGEPQAEGVYHMVILEQVTRCLSSSRADFSDAAVMDLLKEFVNATSRSSDSSRLLHLHELLVQSCGRNNHTLWAVVVLLLGNASAEDDDDDRNNMEHQVDFAGQLLARFSVQDQISAVMEMIKVLHRFLPTAVADVEGDDIMEDDEDETKEDSSANPGKSSAGHSALIAALGFDGAVDVARGVAIVNAICELISEHLSSKSFMRMLRSLSQMQVEASGLHGTSGFLGLLNALHGQIHRAGRLLASEEEGIAVWSSAREQLCLILDKISALLSVPMFVAVVQELLRDNDPHVRQLAIRQLAAKVEQQHERWRPEEVLMFLEMVTQLHEIVRDKSESDVNKQVALLAVDVLAKHLGARHAKPFVEVLDSVVKEFRRTSAAINREGVTIAHVQLTSSACLCVGTLITVLGERVLKALPSFGKSLFICFTQSLNLDENDKEDRQLRDARALLGQSAATSIHALVSALPQFLSPYVIDVLTVASRGNQPSAPQLVRLTSARIADKIARKMEPRLILGPLTDLYAKFLEEHEITAARNLVTLVRSFLEVMSRETLVQENARLTAFFVQTLDSRRYVAAGCSELTLEGLGSVAAGLQTLEEVVTEAFMQYVLVLSGSQMKQLFGALRERVQNKNAGVAKGSLFDNLEDTAGAEDDEPEVGSKRKMSSRAAAKSKTSPKDDDENSSSDDDDSESESEVEGEDDADMASVDPAADWQRQCAAATFYLMADELGKKLLGLAVPFITELLDSLKSDLEMVCDDTAASSSKRTKRNAKREDWTMVWRFQQRVVRERALAVVGTFCEHRVANAVVGDNAESMNREFIELLDAVLSPLDMDIVALNIADSDGASSEGGDENDESEEEEEEKDAESNDEDEDDEMEEDEDEEASSEEEDAEEEDSDVLKSDEAYYEHFVHTHVIPCIVKLTKSVMDDTLWQSVQRGVLEYARHAAASVRVACLHAIVALFEDVGDSFIVLLADTLPTVAELLEDRDDRVKREAHRAAKKLQQLSGEDLSSFLQ